MLSVTYEIVDIKARLDKIYSDYDFATNDLFNQALALAVENAMYEQMLGFISQGLYDSLKALDKTGLSLQQSYIYRAEVCFSCYQFLKSRAQIEDQSRSGNSESISTDGYSRSISGEIGVNGYAISADQYLKDGKNNLAMAGVKTTLQLKRGNSNLSEDRNVWPNLV